MKIKKFNEKLEPLDSIFKIFASVEENTPPLEYSGSYKTYNKAYKEILDWIDNGLRDKKVYDAYIVKVTKEILNNDDIKARIDSKKYNI